MYEQDGVVVVVASSTLMVMVTFAIMTCRCISTQMAGMLVDRLACMQVHLPAWGCAVMCTDTLACMLMCWHVDTGQKQRKKQSAIICTCKINLPDCGLHVWWVTR